MWVGSARKVVVLSASESQDGQAWRAQLWRALDFVLASIRSTDGRLS